MKQRSGSKKELDSYIEDIRDRQRNTVFPDTIRGGRSIDALLWKGDAKAPLVQRIGIMVFAFWFALGGLATGLLAYRDKSRFLSFVTFLIFALVIRLTLNAFKKS